eukprot:Colp12_sorted_trinity150504_noHs@6625
MSHLRAGSMTLLSARSCSAIGASARYLREELPVRLALRALAFQKLPYIVGCNPYIRQVYELYLSSFEHLRLVEPIESIADEEKYTVLLEKLVADHVDVVNVLARGVRESLRFMPSEKLDQFVDDTLKFRTGVRMLAENHLALHRDADNFIGIVCTNLHPKQVIERVAEITTEMCEHKYGIAPRVVLDGHLDTAFSYIPFHLEYSMLELLKNAMRAVVEFALASPDPKAIAALPPIRVTICKGDTDISIRISDQGGGIPADKLGKVWQYGFTTVKEDVDAGSGMLSALMEKDRNEPYGPIAGLGFGLPMSRVYAEYFGGSLQLYSLHGYGTDVYLRLNHIGDQLENIDI